MKSKLFVIGFFLAYSILAQVNEIPVHFGQYFNNPQLNPAKGGSDSKIEVYNGNRRNQGGFGGIKTSYASIFFRLKEQKESFHTLGLSFNNDREGSFLARNRAYISYSRHQKINENWKLSAGFSSGFYNFSVKSNPVLGGASSGGLDLNLGLNLYSSQSSLGFSINQLNGAEVQPFNQTIKLVPQYNVIGEHQLELTEKLMLTPSAFFRYANLELKELNTRIGGGLNLLISNFLNLGGSLETKEGVYAFVGFHNISINESSSKYKNMLAVDISYFIPNINNTRTNINAFELTLKYFISNK
jgi:type IX secretion system PorP/SprF family membrane protein